MTSRVTATLKHELLALVPPTVYFFVALHVIALVRSLMVSQTGITLPATMSIGVAALILGKAVLIADLMPFIDRFPDRPRLYNVLWKTAIYLLLAGFIHYLERLWHATRASGGLLAGNRLLLEEMVWPHFWAIQLLLCILIMVYCAARELARAIGRDTLKRIFLGPMQPGSGLDR